MSRTALAVAGLAVLFGVIALVVPWVLAGDRYTTTLELEVALDGKPGFVPAACGAGRGAPRPFDGVYFVLGGAHPRVLVPRTAEGAPREVVLDTAPRPTRFEASACARLEGRIDDMGRDAHKVEGVTGDLDLKCALPDGRTLELKGRFDGCFRPS